MTSAVISGFAGIESDAVILDDDLDGSVPGPPGDELDMADAVASHHAVEDGIFDHWLHGNGGNHKFIGLDVVADLDVVAEAQLLQADVIFDMRQLVIEGDGGRAVDAVHVLAQVDGEVIDGAGCQLGILAAQGAQCAECVVEEVGTNLAHGDVELALHEFPLLLD